MGSGAVTDRQIWPIFTARYGIHPAATRIEPGEHWWFRHLPHDRGPRCEGEDRFRCRCPERVGAMPVGCCQRATAEDGQCDRCREGCIVSDGVVSMSALEWRLRGSS